MKRRYILVLFPLTVLALGSFALTDQAFAADGSVSGTVTDSVTHAGIADIQVYASLVDQGGPPIGDVVTAADGTYVIAGLAPGAYILSFNDQDGAANGGDHADEFYSDSICQDFADQVIVADGASVTGINAALSGCGTIHGWVEGDGVRLLNARVQAFCWVPSHQAWEWYPLEWQAVDPDSGEYVLERVRIGQWALGFSDWDQVYAGEYHPDAHFVWDAQTVLVSPGSDMFVKGDLDLGGTLRGHVFSSTGVPLEGVTVALYDWNPDTQQWGWAGAETPTGPDGSYQMRGLDTWSYRLSFIPPYSSLAAEYWNNVAGLDGALDLTWGVGQAREGYDAWLGTPDGVAPVTGIAGLPASAWSRLPLALTLTASDAGSGVELTQYRLDGGAWTRGTAFGIPASSTHANDGLHVIEYRSADFSGNWEPAHTSRVNIDTTAPVGALTLAGVPAGWSRRNVTFTLAAADLVSDAASIEYSLAAGGWTPYASPVAVSTEGETLVSYRGLDTAGNTGEVHTATVRIDKTGPATRALAKVAVRKGRRASFRLRVDDRTPTASVTIKIYKGKKLVKRLPLGQRTTNTAFTYRWKCTLAKGGYTWRVYAIDLAGNQQRRMSGSTFSVR